MMIDLEFKNNKENKNIDTKNNKYDDMVEIKESSYNKYFGELI